MKNSRSMIVAVLMACMALDVNAVIRVIADFRLSEGCNQVTFTADPDRLLGPGFSKSIRKSVLRYRSHCPRGMMWYLIQE